MSRAVIGLLGALTMPLLFSGCATVAPESSPPVASASMPRHAHIPPARAPQGQLGLSELAIHAIGLVGVPYRWGGNTPHGGFDCSGLVVYVARRAQGLTLPRTVAEMSRVGEEVLIEDRLPGDLVFFNTSGHPFSHVGIYVGQNRFVHAPNEGGTVRIDSLVSAYWGPRITVFRRLAS
ncbi:MAG: C40 family peptidase [Burkholderiaceae bacterium]